MPKPLPCYKCAPKLSVDLKYSIIFMPDCFKKLYLGWNINNEAGDNTNSNDWNSSAALNSH